MSNIERVKKSNTPSIIIKLFTRILKFLLPMNVYIKIRNIYRITKDKKKFNIGYLFPSSINIEITNDCNLSCIMCGRTYWNAPPEDIKYMEPGLVKKLVDEASQYNSSVAFFANGEPLLHPQLVSFIKYAKQKNINTVSINTNATLLTGKLSKKIIQSGLDNIVFSVDGILPETYNMIRRKGDYKTVEKNILNFLNLRSKLKSPGPIVTMQLVPMIYNYHEILKYIKFWIKKLNPEDTIFLHQICPFDPYEYKKSHFKIGIFNNKLKQIKKQIINYLNIFDKEICRIEIEDFKKNPKFHPCLLLWSNFYIPADGIVKVCWCSPEDMPRIFNIRNSTIKEIYNHKIYKKIRRIHIKGEKAGRDYKELGCHKCRLWQRSDIKTINYKKLTVIKGKLSI